VDGDLTGVILDGRYRVLEPISEGAMGVVYRAERLKLGRIVAIKVLHDELPAELSSRQRFEIEATAMAKLEHPHCAAVIDVGVYEDKPFVVMDYVSGDNLRDVVANGPLPMPRAVEIMRQVLSGLAHAHELGIIHRDIKPANVVLSQKVGLGDHVKLLDFGLARISDESKLTKGIVVGTPSYMAPEQIRGTAIDHRADLYSAGVLLFELLTGKKPFVSPKDDPVEVCSMHLKNPPPTLHQMQAGIEYGELEVIVARALAKQPDDRYATAVEFAAALDAVPQRGSLRRSAPIAVASPIATETGWAVPPDAASVQSAPVPSSLPGGASGPTVPTPIPVGISEPVAALPAAVAWVPAPPVEGAAPSTATAQPTSPPAESRPAPRGGKLPPAPFARSARKSVGPSGQQAGPPESDGWSKPVSAPVAAPSSTMGFDPSSALAAAAAAAAAVESTSQPVAARGLPADFDLSRAIPRDLKSATEKGLSPAFDLSTAIPSPDLASAAMPPAEPPHAETMLGLVAVEPAKPEPKLGLVAVEPAKPEPKLGLVAVEPAKPETKLGLVAVIRSQAPATSSGLPPEGHVPSLPDHNATAMFQGAPPSGPSPLEAADLPAVAEPVALPAPLTLPALPVTKKHLQILGGVAAGLILIAIIVGACSKSSVKPAPPATKTSNDPPVAKDPTVIVPNAAPGADEQLAQATAKLDAGNPRAAIDQLVAARTKYPDDARLSYLLGTLYFRTKSSALGLQQFHDTLALDGTYRADPELIKTVLKAFLAAADYPSEIGAFLRTEIGAPARQYLEEAATKHPRPPTRARAKAELSKLP